MSSCCEVQPDVKCSHGVSDKMRGAFPRRWIRTPGAFLSHGRGVELDNARQDVFTRRLNIFTVFNKEARAKEKARLQDELNRGYFDDFREMKRTGGKVAPASASLSPIAGSPRFPPLEICILKGPTLTLTLPLEDATGPTLVCVAFRASAQPMVLSWSAPFAQKFAGSTSIKVFEVSVIESSLLSIWPIKPLLLQTMRGS